MFDTFPKAAGTILALNLALFVNVLIPSIVWSLFPVVTALPVIAPPEPLPSAQTNTLPLYVKTWSAAVGAFAGRISVISDV